MKKSIALFWVTLTTALFVLLFLLSFSRAMNRALSHDEYQFVASGQILADHGRLPYIDFPFLHLPYLAVVNALAAKLSANDLLMARSFNAVFGVLASLAIFFFAQHLLLKHKPWFRNLASLLAAVLFAADPVFIAADGKVMNHALPNLLGIGAFILVYLEIRSPQSSLNSILSGLLIGIATGTRLTYLVLIPVFACALISFPADQNLRIRLRRTIRFGTGVFLGLLPVIIMYLLAPRQFFFGNYVYIRLNTIYRQYLHFTETMTLKTKVDYFFDKVLNNPIDLLIYSGTVIYALFNGFLWIKTRVRYRFEALLITAISLAMFLTAFAPTPTYPQYFFAPLAFMIIGLLYALNEISHRSILLGTGLTGLVMVLILTSGSIPYMAKYLPDLPNTSEWLTIRFHRYAEMVRSNVPEGKILSLAPIIPLEAGLDTYDMFIVGPFVWRTAHLMGADQRQKYDIISYHELDAYLESDPPDGILVGVEANYEGFEPFDDGGLERPFIAYALQHKYQPIDFPDEFEGIPTTLWIRQAGGTKP